MISAFKDFLLSQRLKKVDFDLAAIAVDQSLRGSAIPRELARVAQDFVARPSLETARRFIAFDPKFAELLLRFSSSSGTEEARLDLALSLFPLCAQTVRIESRDAADSYFDFDASALEELWQDEQAQRASTRWFRVEYRLFRRWLSQRSRHLDSVQATPGCFAEFFDDSIRMMHRDGQLRAYCGQCKCVAALNEVAVSRGDGKNYSFGFALGCSVGHMLYSTEGTLHLD